MARQITCDKCDQVIDLSIGAERLSIEVTLILTDEPGLASNGGLGGRAERRTYDLHKDCWPTTMPDLPEIEDEISIPASIDLTPPTT